MQPPPTDIEMGPRRKSISTPRQGGRPPLRRAALDTSPPIDGGEEGRQAVRGRRIWTLESLRSL
ncbi:hypothetical protein FJW05_26630 [Mesorhizobium sp. B2-9-1]|nr:hypothetical protein FJW05_26630 [Mesorhizobium sp. B2-9-1]